jgi:hypothetical protein
LAAARTIRRVWRGAALRSSASTGGDSRSRSLRISAGAGIIAMRAFAEKRYIITLRPLRTEVMDFARSFVTVNPKPKLQAADATMEVAVQETATLIRSSSVIEQLVKLPVLPREDLSLPRTAAAHR